VITLIVFHCITITTLLGTDSKFEEYGVEFTKDDVVAAYLNLDCNPIQISFTKNGEAQGTAFEVPKSQLAGKALFPHIR